MSGNSRFVRRQDGSHFDRSQKRDGRGRFTRATDDEPKAKEIQPEVEMIGADLSESFSKSAYETAMRDLGDLFKDDDPFSLIFDK